MKNGLIVGIIVLLIVVGSLYYLYEQGYFFSVNIVGVNIKYIETTLSVFKNVHETAYNTSISIHGGQTFVITIEFSNNGLLPVKITYINVSSPFTLVSTTPTVPITLNHGSSVNLSFDIKAPMKSYAGPITIYINGTSEF